MNPTAVTRPRRTKAGAVSTPAAVRRWIVAVSTILIPALAALMVRAAPAPSWALVHGVVGAMAGALAGMVLQEAGAGLLCAVSVGVVGALLTGVALLGTPLPGEPASLFVMPFAAAAGLSALTSALTRGIGRGPAPPCAPAESGAPPPEPTAWPWRQRHPYLISFGPALVLLSLSIAAHDKVVATSTGTPVGIAETINSVATVGSFVLYGVVVAASVISLGVPRLRQCYARALWTTVLLLPFMLAVAAMMGLVPLGQN